MNDLVERLSLWAETDVPIQPFIGGPLCREAADEIERLRGALEEIVSPIRFMRERLKDGEKLDGIAAVMSRHDPEYLRSIAIAALSPNSDGVGVSPNNPSETTSDGGAEG